MAQKLLACDFDNTLAFRLEDGTVGFRSDDVQAIARWRAAGNVFAVDSGRTLSWLTPVVESEWDYLIFSSGAGVLGTDGTVRDLQALDRELVRRVVETSPYRPEVSVEGMDDVWTLCRRHEHQLHVTDIASFDDIPAGELCGFGYHFGNEGEAREFDAWLEESFPGAFSHACNQTNVDVVAPGADKGRTLHKLATRLGIAHEDTYAIGDADNDLPMLRAVGHPATFHTSPDLHGNAELVVDSVAELIDIILAG